MVRRYIFGEPINTDAVIKDIPAETGGLPFFSYENGVFSCALGDRDIVYGLGEQVRGLNKRGWRYSSYNYDNVSHHEDALSLYGAHNFLLISGAELFGVFFDCPGRIDYDIGYTRSDVMTISAAEADMNVYIITGDSERDILRQLRHLTGRSYAAPRWAFGYGQSRWGYKSAEDIRDIARSHRSRNIPLDMIYLDIDYMERYKDFTVNNETFPDLEGLAREMKEQGIRLIPIIDAGVKIEEGYDVYEEGVKNGYFCKDGKGGDFIAAVWPGRVHFPDFMNKDARRWFGDKYAFLIDKGIEGFWNDMNEPSVFYTEGRLKSSLERIKELAGGNMGIDCYFELQNIVGSLSSNPEDHKTFYHNMDGVKVRHDRVHNLYGTGMVRSAAEGFERIAPDRRMLLISRSSFIGTHRYGGVWQGDNKSWWQHLLMNIKMTASLNMAGFLYTGADCGGFNCDVTEDLMLRWLQFSLFTPLMRNHSALGTREQEIYRFGNCEACRRMIEIRYGLLPYLYSEYMKAVLRDDVMFRPMQFDFPDDISRVTEDQLLLGDELMLAPVYTQNASGRYVWLPEEMMLIKMRSLTDYDTEAIPAGSRYIRIAPHELAFFIRKGRAVPLCSGGQYADDIDMSTLKLIGYENARYELYDDDGVSADISEDNIRVIG